MVNTQKEEAEPGDEELFLILGDETSGKETYGAGRYLYVDAPDENGRIDLDFNRAYNPPGAFTAFATCPLPPRQNRLALAIACQARSMTLSSGTGRRKRRGSIGVVPAGRAAMSSGSSM